MVTRQSQDRGFTLLEMMIVMFLLVAILGLVVPRINLGEDLGSTGRKLISAIRTLRSMAMTTHKPVKLTFDLDRGTYRAVAVEGREDKPLADAAWAEARVLPEQIRLTDVTVGSVPQQSGRMDLLLYPNGRVDPLILHLTDAGNNILGIAIEPTTGAMRTSDTRMDPPRQPPIPDRVKTLLTPSSTATVQGKPRL